MYKPHTISDQRRYVNEVDLDRPIYFWMENPSECGISLSDALHSRVRRLLDREQTVFEGRGPSVSIRLEVNNLFFSSRKSFLKTSSVARLSPMESSNSYERFSDSPWTDNQGEAC